jgi:dipeptidyl aminopeptidase/acylaminoacyl peptidase
MPRLCFLLLFITCPVAAQPARDHAITIDDYATLATIRELAVSPDGKFVAYTEARWDKADDLSKTDLWVVSTDGKGKPTRLTGDRANDRKPKWSHDGKTIYVLGNRKREAETKPPYDGKAQVWRVPVDVGDPRAVTRVEGGVTGFDYAPKSDALFYSVDSSATDKDEFTDLRSKFKAEYGHGTRKVSEIHRLDLQSWRSEKIVDEKRYVREFAVTQDGRSIAMVSAIDDTVVKSEGESRVDVWESGKVVTPATDAYRAKGASPHAWLENLCWNPEGTRFAFTAVHDGFPAEIIIGSSKSQAWDTTRLSREAGLGRELWEVVGYGRGLGPPLRWGDEKQLVGLYEEDGVTGMFSKEVHAPSGSSSRVVNTDKNVLGFDFLGSNSGPIYIAGSISRMAVVSTNLEKDLVLFNPNPQAEVWRFPSVKHTIWKAPDGSQVGGILELPPDYKKGDKLPLVVGIHGGPTTSTKAELSYDPHNGRLYFAAHGYAALFPNYRGSTGYGDKFVTDLIGHENDIEVKDILAGIQHLIKEGIADPDRIGVMGWSNGGYLTNCLITMKDPPVKFKAASSGAGILDTVAEWGFNDEPAYPIVFKKGLPWETPEIYRKTSPTYGLGNVTTPTLIHVGGGDERCPPGHSRMLYRALKEYTKVPTELVVYPGEPHGLTKLSNRKAKMEWDLAWFDKYVKGK